MDQSENDFYEGPVLGFRDERERTWTILCHFSAFLGYLLPFGHILGPLGIWLFKGSRYPQVNIHGKEALNFQLSITIYVVIAYLLVVVGIGIFLLIALGVFDFVAVIIASVKAKDGRFFRYPLTIRMIR